MTTPIVREDYVLLRPITDERKAGSIIMVSQGQPEKRAEVVAAGPGAYTPQGTFMPTDLEPGDRVYYSAVEHDVMVPTGGSYERLLVVRAQRIFMREARS